MATKKVFEVAKQFAVSPTQLIQTLQGLGSKASSPMSPVEPLVFKKLVEGYESERADRRKVVAGKRKELEEAAEKRRVEEKRKKAEREAAEAAAQAEAAAAEEAAKAAAEADSDDTVEAIETDDVGTTSEDPNTLVDLDAEPEEPVEEAETQPPVEVATIDPIEPDAAAPAPEAPPEDLVSEEIPAAIESADAPESTEEVKPPEDPVIVESAPSVAAVDSAGPAVPKRPGGPVILKHADPAEQGTGPRKIDGPVRAGTVAGAVSRRAERKRKKRQSRSATVDPRTVRDSVRKTLAQMSSKDKRKKKRRTREDEVTISEENRTIQMAEYATVSELAASLAVGENEVIMKLMELGVMSTRNQRLDFDTMVMVGDEFAVTVTPLGDIGEDRIQDVAETDGEQEPRHPIVTVMGHVDHGKTSLLDYIRNTSVVKGEKGGITQHVGAYQATTEKGRITFIDTPGHEAFTAMRLRGAQTTDIVILVVAADDGVMPQTREAIDHVRAAGVPMVLAINKCDLPAANPDRVKQELTEHNIVVEDYGGKVQAVQISAKTGDGIEQLLDTIILEAELLELTADPNRRATGTIIEAYLDKGRGPVATALVAQGTLRVGDAILCGTTTGKIRAMLDEFEERVEQAGPATPVKLLGLSGVPQAGDSFQQVKDEKEARGIAEERAAARATQEMQRRRVSLESVFADAEAEKIEALPIIVKGDVDGSVEALSDALEKISTDEVQVKVIRRAVGGINESDVMLAATSSAVILGFNVRPADRSREIADRERVDIRLYDVIYDAVNDVTMALEGLLTPDLREKFEASIDVREVFKIPKVGTIAGCYITSGRVNRNHKVRVIREDIAIFDSTVSSLRRFKDDVKEVAEGFECGVGVDRFNDLKVGDRLEVYSIEEIARTLN